MNAITDERLSRPSASSMERYFACAGAWALEQMAARQRVIPEGKGESAAAAHGTLIHEALETSDTTDLAYSEEEQVKICRQREEEITKQWCADFEIPFDKIAVIREKRFWFDQSGCSAKVDLLVLYESHCLICDAKAGRLPVPPPVQSWQLRTQAACVVSELSFTHVRVAIVNVFGALKPPCDLPAEDLNRIAIILRAKLKEIEQPNLPVTVSENCRYCPGKSLCSAQRDNIGAVIQQRTLDWNTVPLDRYKPLLIAVRMARDAADVIEEQIVATVRANPEQFPEFTVKPDSTVRKITSATKASLALHAEVGGNDFDVMKAVLKTSSLSLKNFATLYRDMTGKGATDAEAFLKRCSDLIVESPRKGSVVPT